MHELWPHVAALVVIIAISPFSQLLMKIGASSQRSAVRSFLNPWTLAG